MAHLGGLGPCIDRMAALGANLSRRSIELVRTADRNGPDYIAAAEQPPSGAPHHRCLTYKPGRAFTILSR